MVVKNNYNECLTNLACSIRRYFELDYKHNTLEYIDKILDEKKPKNVICILFDGMGSCVINNALPENSFFRKNKLKDIYTVFPATTTAATTSMRTGLNPCEHGWLGWNTYIKPIDKIITLFRNTEYDKEEVSNEFLNVKNLLVTETIVSEINDQGKYSAVELFPFLGEVYSGLDDMVFKIKKEAKKDGKKFIYVYDDVPDASMHEYGCDSDIASEVVRVRNNKIEELCNELEDSLVIVVADHGHMNCEYVHLDDCPELVNMLDREISLEQRTLSFKVKDGLHDQFEKLFNENFGKYFTLYKSSEVIESKLFGDGEENVLYRDALGDFIAISENNNKCLTYSDWTHFKSNHAGYMDDEILVPLIVVDKCN
jgi:predicted AlkP superfamily pyrophosphatase or phosphodiesterase